MRVDDAGDAHPAAGDLLDHQRVGQQRLTEAAVLLRDHQPEDAELLEPVDDLLRVDVAVLELLRVRDDLLVDEAPDRRQDLAAGCRSDRRSAPSGSTVLLLRDCGVRVTGEYGPRRRGPGVCLLTRRALAWWSTRRRPGRAEDENLLPGDPPSAAADRPRRRPRPYGRRTPQYAPPGYAADPATRRPGTAPPRLVRRPASTAGPPTRWRSWPWSWRSSSRPPGLILGIVARKQIRQTGEDGDGLALAGIIVGGDRHRDVRAADHRSSGSSRSPRLTAAARLRTARRIQGAHSSGGVKDDVRSMPAARPLPAMTSAILRLASSIISSPSIAEPFLPPASDVAQS